MSVADTITIPLSVYKTLVQRNENLTHLESLGVDNWEGYSLPGWDDDENEDED